MSYANLDDRAFAHPKVRRLARSPDGLQAWGIWAWSLSWCRNFAAKDGRLDLEEIADAWRLDPLRVVELILVLVRVKLVDRVTDDLGLDDVGYVIHDWADWQLSPQQRGGKARAASAERAKDGSFVPAEGVLDTGGRRAGRPAGTPPNPSLPFPPPSRARPRGGAPRSIGDTINGGHRD